MRKIFRLALICLAWALLALPAIAADDTIFNGIDLWQTRGDGSTYRDFREEPIPAGFFCAASEPFTGKIVFQGVPVVTSPKGVLGVTDTIVQRLDDAKFNEDGYAQTRLQVRALNFVSTEPIQTACGPFNVKVTLAGEQELTKMTIVRLDEHGGFFLSPISVDVRLMFFPVNGKARTQPIELVRSLRFAPAPNARWTSEVPRRAPQHGGFVAVDTDGDGRTDVNLPGTSNFGAGFIYDVARATFLPNESTCHCDYSSCGYQHCTGGVLALD